MKPSCNYITVPLKIKWKTNWEGGDDWVTRGKFVFIINLFFPLSWMSVTLWTHVWKKTRLADGTCGTEAQQTLRTWNHWDAGMSPHRGLIVGSYLIWNQSDQLPNRKTVWLLGGWRNEDKQSDFAACSEMMMMVMMIAGTVTSEDLA